MMYESVDTDDLPSMDEASGASGSNTMDDELTSHIAACLPSAWFGNHQNELNLSERHLHTIPDHYVHNGDGSTYSPANIRTLILRHNYISHMAAERVSAFTNVHTLDLTGNLLTHIPDAVCRLEMLTVRAQRSSSCICSQVLTLANNHLTHDSFPKSLTHLYQLKVLNVGGNHIDTFPPIILELVHLQALYIGANRLQSIPTAIGLMNRLQLLYLGGNRLRDIPASIGQLASLQSLALCDNRLETIPNTIAHLQQLQSLSLHNNRLTTLPPEIIKLKHLHQLSLRSNPLVAQFVCDMELQPASLLELAGRVVHLARIPYHQKALLPVELEIYLDSANECVNPKCKGVYFSTRVEHVKFVDFCGKYRVPLLQYLCSTKCTNGRAADANTTTASSEYETDDPNVPTSSSHQQRRTKVQNRLRKVLLG